MGGCRAWLRAGLRCAIGIQRALATYNADTSTPIRVRIGLHTGEAVRKADDFFGRHVNLAARIGAAAKAGEILASGLLVELASALGEFRFGEADQIDLKGLRGSHRVHRVEWREPANG